MPSVAFDFARGTDAKLVFKFVAHGMLDSLIGYVVNRVAGHFADLLFVQIENVAASSRGC